MRFFPLKILLIFSFLQLNFAHSRVENKIIVKIDNQIITNIDVENEIKLTLLLSNQQISQKNVDQMDSILKTNGYILFDNLWPLMILVYSTTQNE